MVTGKEIWAAAEKDPELMESVFQHKKPRAIFQDYIENDLLVAIGDILDKPANIENVLDVKIAYIKNTLETGLMSRLIEAVPQEVLGFFTAGSLLEMVTDMLLQAIEILGPIAKDVPAFLKENGVSDKFLYEQLKFSPENIAMAIGNKLTIGDLLISQPAVILKNTE
jgi:hypothetical protein